MSVFELALLAGLLVVAILTRHDVRAWVWLGIIAANYIVTSAYYAYELPAHPFFTLLMDALVCFAIIVKWEHRWEAALCWVFGVSVAIDLARLFVWIDSHAYATGLELVNWAALLTIGGPRLIELANAGLDSAGLGSRRVRRLGAFLAASRHPASHWHP